MISSAGVKEEVGVQVKRESITKTPSRGSGSASTGTAALAAKRRDYFVLREPLAPLYRSWSEGDPRMAAVAATISGVRVVR